MAPIKFEEHIKEKLDKREITPSDNAWSKLSKQLEPGKQGSKMRFFRIGIAASIIGLLIVLLVYNNAGHKLKEEGNKTVAAPNFEDQEKPRTPLGKKTVEVQGEVSIAPGSSEVVDKDLYRKVNKMVGDITETKLTNPVKVPNVVAVKDSIFLEGDEKVLIASNSIFKAKIEAVVAQVKLLEENNISLTDAEVDSLLQQAQYELFSEKIFREDHSVDAMALLADVEGELDQSFREQIFKMLKEGYFKVKTAVAARNN